jgi:hypothetical protein
MVDDVIVEPWVALAEVSEQSLQPFAAKGAGHFLRLARRSILHRPCFIGSYPLFGVFLGVFAIFFSSNPRDLGRRASSNIRNRSAARPPGGSGVCRRRLDHSSSCQQ